MWRFPALAFQYGGGAFFIPYLLALFVLGIPMLLMEVSLGQFLQRGDPEVFGAIHGRLRGLGLSSIVTAYFLMCYYAMLLCWTIRSFFELFKFTEEDVEGITGEDLFGYFLNVTVGKETLPEDNMPSRLVGPNVGYLFLTWSLVFLAVAFGVKVLGKISFFPMGLPLVLLFVFLGKALSLPGAPDGIYAYIGQWDFGILTEQPNVWSEAATQVSSRSRSYFTTRHGNMSHCHIYEASSSLLALEFIHLTESSRFSITNKTYRFSSPFLSRLGQ